MKKPLFKWASLIFTASTFVLSVLFETSLHKGWSKSMTMLLISMNGFFVFSAFSVVYEWAVSLMPDVSEDITGGFINTVANVMGFLEIIII